MNLSTLALILLAWQLLGNTQNTRPSTPPPQIGISDFLSDDTKNVLNCVNKLSSNQCSQEDKTNAIFQMMANPAVMKMASNLFGGAQNGAQSSPQSNGENATTSSNASAPSTDTDEHVNSEGYRFETPSADSQEFFRPIDNIADAEIKHKLYWFYDHWYL